MPHFSLHPTNRAGRAPRAGTVGAVVTALLCGAVWSVSIGAGAAHGVTVDQTYPVAGDRTITLAGRGFGHGHGLSQYGAQGAALRGLSAEEILAFYYPGTTPSSVRGALKVRISADTDDDTVVLNQPGLRVRDLGRRTVTELDTTGARRWRLRSGLRGGVVVSRLDRLTDRWRTVPLAGSLDLVGDGQLEAPAPLTLVTPGGTRTYRGSLRAASPVPGGRARDTVNVLSLDDYLQGVVPAEMPASWRPAAVQAQAVAARSYAAWSRDQFRTRYYQICDTTACQVYSGTAREDPRSNAAVVATSRRILTADGRAAFTQFSASNGGWSSAGSRPYLVSQADPYDDASGTNPVFTWRVNVAASSAERAYPAVGRLRSVRVVEREGGGSWGGRVRRVVLVGSEGQVTVSGDTLRSLWSLRSTWFAGA